jgi:hypothetical protein
MVNLLCYSISGARKPPDSRYGLQKALQLITLVFQMIQALQVSPGVCFLKSTLTVARLHILNARHAIAAANLKDIGFDHAESAL